MINRAYLKKIVIELICAMLIIALIFVGCNITSLSREIGIVDILKTMSKKAWLLTAILFVSLLEAINIAKDSEKKVNWLFAVILFFSIIIVFGKFILAKSFYIYTGVGSDSYLQYYPYYINEVKHIKEGIFSVWNWDYGLGICILNMAAWTCDPYAILMVLIGVIFGPGCIEYLIVWMQIAKIVTLYCLGRKLFKYWLNDVVAINVSALLLAFNGYIMLWGQHYFMGTAIVYVMVLLWSIESYLHNDCKRNTLFLIFAVAAILLYSYYFGYMILLFAAGYFIYRYCVINKIKWKKLCLDFAKTIYAVISGVLLAGVIFIPACHYVTTTSTRLEGANTDIVSRFINSFKNSFSFDEIGYRMSRLLTNNGLHIENMKKYDIPNYYELPQLVVTVFFFFIIGQWVVLAIKKAKDEHTWISFIVKCFLFYMLIFNSGTGLIMNGFAFASYRYTFVAIPIVCVCVGAVLQDVIFEEKISLLGIEIGTILSGVGLIYSYKYCSEELKTHVIFIAAILVVGRLILLMMVHQSKACAELKATFIILMIGSCILEAYYTTNYRSHLTSDNFAFEWEDDNLDNDTADAIAWLDDYDNSFYRLDKTYSNWAQCSDSNFEGYSSVSWYNSTAHSNISDFYRNIYMDAEVDFPFIKSLSLNNELDMRAIDITHTKYLLSKETIEMDDWNLIHTQGDVRIYENESSDSLAKWYCDTMYEADFEQLSMEEKADVLQDTAIIDATFSQNTYRKSNAKISPFTLHGQTKLVGAIECKDTGIVMFAVPDQEGWNLYVDGKKQDTFNCNYGFIGAEITAGNHEVCLKYRIPYFGLGCCASLLGIIMIVCLVVFEKKMQIKTEQNNE